MNVKNRTTRRCARTSKTKLKFLSQVAIVPRQRGDVFASRFKFLLFLFSRQIFALVAEPVQKRTGNIKLQHPLFSPLGDAI
jgi:hypothetical protein